MAKRLITTICFLVAISPFIEAQNWSFEFNPGTAYNVPLPLTIKQQGYPDISINAAKYNSRPFEAPIYWLWRFSRWEDGRSWEFEAIHHKLYLENRPEEVERFSISHGYNILAFARGIQLEHFTVRYGAGVVLTHPENTIRGKKLDEKLGMFNDGYYISGPVLNFGIGHRFYPINRFFINIEGKCSLSYVSIPIVDGNANLYNIAFQLIFGLGFDFISND